MLVGALAIDVHTGDADVADPAYGFAAEYTTDADLTIDPRDLTGSPLVADLLEERGFSLGADPGAWVSPDGIAVDLMVREPLAGPGRRSARLGPHGNRAARRAKGLEGALVDQERVELVSLDPADDRSVLMHVAGPGALLIAKTYKIADRVGRSSRVEDKDALRCLPSTTRHRNRRPRRPGRAATRARDQFGGHRRSPHAAARFLRKL